MKTNNIPLIEFNPKLPKLSKNEQAVLKLLVEAGRLIVPVYLEQEKQLEKDGNFYPKGVSKEEIEKATKKDPSILSPFTVVEKVDNKLVAIPYHVKYAQFLKPIADVLNEASRITENKEFGKFLKVQAKILMNDHYEEAIIASLKMKPYILDFSIGPIDHFDDQLFCIKTSFQAWVGTLDLEGTTWLNDYKSIILSTRRKALLPKERIENHNRVKVKVIDVILFSGLMARTKFVGVNNPINVGIVEKYGSEITLFNQSNDLRMQKQIIPTFNKIFSKGFREGFEYEDLRIGNLHYIAMHELAHSYLYYRHASENLKDLFSPIYELAATILGFRMAGSLLLKDRITNKQLESMITAFLCRNFYLINKNKINKPMIEYATAGAIFINFLIESGALKELKGYAILNFMKIFVAIQDLFHILERLLSMGSRNEAEAFIKRYGQIDNLSSKTDGCNILQ